MSLTAANYPASAGHPDLGTEEITGELRVDRQGLLFEHENGALGLPFARLRIERTDDDRIRFTDPEQPDWAVYTCTDEILRHYTFKQRNELRARVRDLERRREGRRMVRLAFRFVAVFIAIVLVLVLAGPLAVSFLIARVPPSAETQLGELALEELREELSLVEDTGWLRYVEELGAAVQRGLPPHPYRFEYRLVESPWPNAFALPGGTLLVTTGLLEQAESAEEVAGVLAHEMAHVLHRHGLRTLITSAGPLYVLQLFVSDRQGFLAVVTQGSQVLLSQSFSRDYEREADRSGFQYLLRAGIDPRGLARFLESSRERMGGSGALDRIPEVLLSHPPDAERLRYLAELWDRSPTRTGFVPLAVQKPPSPVR